MSAFHDLKLKALDGQELALAPFKGKSCWWSTSPPSVA